MLLRDLANVIAITKSCSISIIALIQTKCSDFLKQIFGIEISLSLRLIALIFLRTSSLITWFLHDMFCAYLKGHTFSSVTLLLRPTGHKAHRNMDMIRKRVSSAKRFVEICLSRPPVSPDQLWPSSRVPERTSRVLCPHLRQLSQGIRNLLPLTISASLP